MRSALVAGVLCLLVMSRAQGQQQPRPLELPPGEENVALGRPYLFSAIPDYRLTHNDTDLQDLTDGFIVAHDKIWFDAGACAWYGDPHLNIRVDLGEVYPIKEIGIRLLGGREQAGLRFPAEVIVLVSDDGITWRQVGRFVKPGFGPEDGNPLGMPPEEGVAYTYPLRFSDLGTAGRYVNFKITGDSAFIASDELWVLKGNHPVAGANRGTPYSGELIVHNFRPGALTAFFPKPRIYACNNAQSYQTLFGLDNRPEQTRNKAAEILVDLPDGVTLRRFKLNPRFGGAVADQFATEQIEDGGRTFTRYLIPTRGIWIKEWGTLFLQTTWEEGRSGPLRLGCRWEGGEQEPEEYTIEAVHLPPVTPPRQLLICVAWMTQMFWMDWPDGLQTSRACGFTAMPIFPRYAPKRDTPQFQDYLNAVRAARDLGFTIADNESPIHAVVSQSKEHPEVMCQLPTGPGPMPCPSYRGQLWQEEVENIAQRYCWTQAEWMLYDCEAFSGYGYRAEQAKTCTRCQEAYRQHGGTWEKFISDQAAEFYRAVHARIRELASQARFQAGAYGVRPGEVYHGVWDWDILHPELHQFAMPSLYSFRPAPVGDEVRRLRALMTASDIIPWVQPGDLGEMPAEHVRAILLEVLLNGGRGVAYYTSEGFDGADLRAVAQAIAIVQPIEDLILEGELLDLTDFHCDRAQVRLGGVRCGNQAVLLVSEYDWPGTLECRVTLPARVNGPVYELTPEGRREVPLADGGLTVALDQLRARVYLLSLNQPAG